MKRADVVARLKSVEPALRAHGVGALYLFGSYGRDEAGPESDIDVFVDPGSDRFYGLDHYTAAYDAIREALPGFSIGYGTRSSLSQSIRQVAEREALRVF